MDNGRIAEQGTHVSLLAVNGRYAHLYKAQFAGRTGRTGTTEAGR
jgi:ABC-type multidrug transport system fused ATPase/permease subunit